MRFNSTVLFSGSSQYGSYKVIDTSYDGRPARVLYGDKGSPQSGMARDDNPELLFDYNQRFLEMMLSIEPRKVLVIGGGAFMLPNAALHRFPNLVLDVVEIDALLVQISYEYFDLPKDDHRLRVHVGDGAAFVRRTQEVYDMIIIDAFSGYTIPPHLLQYETLRQYQEHLKPNGVIAINFISEYKRTRQRLAHRLIAAFQEVFPSVSLYQADPTYPQGEEQNHILVAGQRVIQFDYLQSAAVEQLS